jgi:hypothetical protein
LEDRSFLMMEASMRPTAARVALGLLLSVGLQAQQSASAPQTFRSGTRLVQVSVSSSTIA